MSGEMPRVEPHLLTERLAQRALNTVLWRGGVESLRGASFVKDPVKTGTKLTIYRDGQHLDDDTRYWLTFNGDVDITRGPVADDELGRLFYTGDGVPKLTNSLVGWSEAAAMPLAFYNLGIPAPASPVASVSGTPAVDAEPVSIVVAYAYVTTDGYVGPLSLGHGPITYSQGQLLTVSSMQTGPSGAYNISHKNVYVSVTDADGATALRFWMTANLAASSINGQLDFTLLGEEADTPSLIAPPADLFGLMLHPNGFLVGFTTRKYCRSEVFKPHGWPSAYQDPIGPDIVGGAIIGQTVVICTKGQTFAATGSDPLNQHISDFAGEQPCVAKRTIRAMPHGVLYASPDGLVLAGSVSSPLMVVSEAFFTREQWQAFNPSSMHAVIHDRRYNVFWKVDETHKGSIIFDFGVDGRIHQVVETDQWYSAAYTDKRRDEMFVAGADGFIYKWDAGDKLTTLWRSREIRMPRPQNVGAVRIMAKTYPVRFRLYDSRKNEDGEMELRLMSEVDVTSDRPERLHGSDRCTTIHWEIETTASWTQVELASSIYEILKRQGSG